MSWVCSSCGIENIDVTDLFNDLEEVRERTYWWMIDYNEERSHDSLEDMTPVEYMINKLENSTFELSEK